MLKEFFATERCGAWCLPSCLSMPTAYCTVVRFTHSPIQSCDPTEGATSGDQVSVLDPQDTQEDQSIDVPQDVQQ